MKDDKNPADILALEGQGNWPAHIDREAWEPCGETCRNTCMTCDHNADELFGDADYCTDCHRYSKWQSTVHKYCERCGRPKTPDAWDELEKRLRGGESVYCRHRVMDKCRKTGRSCTFGDDCFEPEETQGKTNADRIRAMSDEELAQFLSDFQNVGGGLSPELCLKYIRQPAEEEV